MSNDINQLLVQMRDLANRSSGIEQSSAPVGENNFQAILKQAVDGVNDVQNQATQMQTAFERGDSNISLAEVMIASQKSNIAFQAALQVRNRLVQAYQDIMNMQV